MAKKSEPDLISLAFQLVGERGWRRFSFTELARRAGVPLARVYAELPDRGAILRGLGRRLDGQMLDLELAELDGMTPRERVFELVMRRLDAMAPYKDGLRTIAREVPRDPALLVAAGCNVGRLSRRLLDAAETADPPAIAAVARRVIEAIYVRTFQVWLDDETPDMARTLAELDRRLQQAEQVARWIRWFGRFRSGDAPPTAAAA
ncbi:MAG TPA: hypothetical protein VM684_05170 [Gaiellales bacterium]|nr:hypothetical protein [Gaiellales bacterium]